MERQAAGRTDRQIDTLLFIGHQPHCGPLKIVKLFSMFSLLSSPPCANGFNGVKWLMNKFIRDIPEFIRLDTVCRCEIGLLTELLIAMLALVVEMYHQEFPMLLSYCTYISEYEIGRGILECGIEDQI